MYYFFQLGHQPQLSTAELEAVLSSFIQTENFTFKQSGNEYLIVETKTELDTTELINKLGGTVKIGQKIKTPDTELQKTIIDYLDKNQTTGKIEFSLNGGDKRLPLELKKQLKNLGRSVRYIEPKNTATILHNKLVDKKTDLTIIDNKIYYTTAIQPFAEMAERDYGRPGSDDKSGMLPPKLSKMMINLSGATNEQTILDPFCGSGTVLTEAATMGYLNLTGSDISEKAVEDTKKNLDWLISNYNLKSITYNLINTDVVKLSEHLENNSINAIITEPYLGNPLHGNESESYIKKQTEELKKIYLDSFKEFSKILKLTGTIIFIIPRFKYNNDWIKIDCVEEIKKLRFKIIPFKNSDCLVYHRPNQHLGREIWKFKKTG